MILKVRYSDVNNFSKVIEKDSKIIDDEISNILKKLDELTIIWQGSDSAQFHDHATAYFKTMRNIPITMRNMTKSIGVAMDGYRTSEDALTKSISAQVEEYPKVGNRMEKAAAFSSSVLQKNENMLNNYNRLHVDSAHVKTDNDSGANPSTAVKKNSELSYSPKIVPKSEATNFDNYRERSRMAEEANNANTISQMQASNETHVVADSYTNTTRGRTRANILNATEQRAPSSREGAVPQYTEAALVNARSRAAERAQNGNRILLDSTNITNG